MIPISDDLRPRRFPIVNYFLIAANVVVFLYELSLGSQLDAFTTQYALIPAQVTAGIDLGDFRNIFIGMFLHAGWLHLLGNMLYLWIFGDNVEDRFGHFGYLIFYLFGGVIAAFAHTLLNPTSIVPTVGASGAIAAVLGAYLILFPRSRVYTFIPLGFFTRLTPLPAVLVLGVWFVLQLFNGVVSVGTGDMGGTAFWAHIGGFVFGMLMGLLMKRNEPTPAPYYWS